MRKSIKRISLMLFGSLAWLVCLTIQPRDQIRNNDGASAMVISWAIPQAFAESDNDNESADNENDHDNESDDNENEVTSSTSAALVCVSQTLVASTLNPSAENENDNDNESADNEHDNDNESADNESENDNESSSGNKVTLCHVPPGNPDNPQTLSISANAVDAHLSNHFGDHLGACSDSDNDNESADNENSNESADNDNESAENDNESSDTTSNNGLSACTAIGSSGTTAGYWVPGSVVNDDGTLNSSVLTSYVSTGGSSTPDSLMKSYRDIRGQ